MFAFKHDQDICAICLENKRSPDYLICGHSFCKQCITKYMTYKTICKKCPLCRNKLTRKGTQSQMFFCAASTCLLLLFCLSLIVLIYL